MDWIASCRLLVTNDSLGLHLAMALNVKFVAFFGPTSSFEVHDYGLGEFVHADGESFTCMPCYSPVCSQEKFCMETFDMEEVADKIKRRLALD
jgi:heptosyltransferase-2